MDCFCSLASLGRPNMVTNSVLGARIFRYWSELETGRSVQQCGGHHAHGPSTLLRVTGSIAYHVIQSWAMSELENIWCQLRVHRMSWYNHVRLDPIRSLPEILTVWTCKTCALLMSQSRARDDCIFGKLARGLVLPEEGLLSGKFASVEVLLLD